MVTSAAATLEVPTGLKIIFYACLYFKLQFVTGEYGALYSQEILFYKIKLYSDVYKR